MGAIRTRHRTEAATIPAAGVAGARGVALRRSPALLAAAFPAVLAAAPAAAAFADGIEAPGCPQIAETAPRRVAAVPAAFELILDDGRHVVLAGAGLPTAEPAARERARAALAALTADRAVVVAALGDADRYGRTPARVAVIAGDGRATVQPGIARPPMVADIAAAATGGPAALPDSPRSAGIRPQASGPGAQDALPGAPAAEDLAAALVAAGEALAIGAPPFPPACLAALRAAERRAERGGRGGWSDGRFAVERADDPTLAARAGRYAVVEGRVLSTGAAGRTRYLNFGRRWTLDFTVVIAESGGGSRAAAGDVQAVPAGARVRVRGWLEARDGALIRLASPGDLETGAD